MPDNTSYAAIKDHIDKMIESRLPNQHLASEDFNNGVKFVTDYVLEFINIKYKPSKWKKFLKKMRSKYGSSR